MRRFLIAMGVALVALGAVLWFVHIRDHASTAGPSMSATATRVLAKADVDPFVQPLIDNEYADAVVVGIVDEQGSRVFGYGSLSPGGNVPPDGKTVFPIGTLTEAFTGSVLADMARRGEVKPDESAQRLLPAGVTLPAAGMETFTLARIAAHKARLPASDELDPTLSFNDLRQYSVPQMFSVLSRWSFPAPPDNPGPVLTDRDYKITGFGVALLGHLLVRASGEPNYEQLVLERLCTPLGLTDTRVIPSDGMKPRLASGHDHDDKPTTPPPPSESYAPNEGLYSTADDLVRFVGAHLGVGVPAGEVGEALKENVSRRPAPGAGESDAAFGWRFSRERDVDTFFENGSIEGYHTLVVFQPDPRRGVVFLSNRAIDGVIVKEVVTSLLSRMAGLPPLDPVRFFAARKQPIADADDYVGRYALPGGPLGARTLTVAREGDHLTIEGGRDMQKQRLYPDARGAFFVKISRVRFSFRRDDKGKVTGLTLHTDREGIPATKLED